MKRLVRFAILIPAVLYLWALLPIWFRPQYTGSPLRKPDATVNVDVVTVAGTTGVPDPAATAAAVASNMLSNRRLKSACEPPTLLKPVVRPAHFVVVQYVSNGKVISQQRYDCTKYV